jgi:hypothetical protein
MTDAFYNLYQISSKKVFDFAGIIGGYKGLINIAIREIESEYPLYTKEQLIEKLKLHNEKLEQEFQKANSQTVS